MYQKPLSLPIMLASLMVALPAHGQQAGVPAPLTITILYDDYGFDERCATDWGFSALIETGDHTVLLDTGTQGSILLENMRVLGKDPSTIGAVVISHAHGDHTGGLEVLLGTGVRPKVYLLASFPAELHQQFARMTEVIDTTPGLEIMPGIRTTGEVSGPIPEQALIVATIQGELVITGCAHPGVVRMAEQAGEVTGAVPMGVIGGFHLGGTSRSTLEGIVARFRELGIRRAGPTHCTGDPAIALFREAYGPDFIALGVGRVLTFLR
jgi:7,8-dihydropterin-6-yl-methyl-4-(beta-D-ribofuranosyl)aminobenzene 5'-phosphate synthase